MFIAIFKLSQADRHLNNDEIIVLSLTDQNRL